MLPKQTNGMKMVALTGIPIINIVFRIIIVVVFRTSRRSYHPSPINSELNASLQFMLSVDPFSCFGPYKTGLSASVYVASTILTVEQKRANTIVFVQHSIGWCHMKS